MNPFLRGEPGRLAVLVTGAPHAAAQGLARLLAHAGAAGPKTALDGAPGALAQRLRPARPGAAAPDPADAADAEDDARRLLAEGLGEGDPVVLAVAAREAPLWARALAAEGFGVAWVLAFGRPAAEAADEAQARRALLGWTAELLAAEEAARGGRRVIVDLERFLAAPEAGVQRIERRLGFELARRSRLAAAEDMAPRPSAAGERTLARPAFAPVLRLWTHLRAAADDAPANEDVTAEAALWLSELGEAAGLSADTPPPPETPPPEASRLTELEMRSRTAEARAEIAAAALAAARRRHAEAEALLQTRLEDTAAQVRDAEARLAAKEGELEGLRSEARALAAELERARADAARRIDALSEEAAARQASFEALAQGFAAEDAQLRERLLASTVAAETAQSAARRLRGERDEAQRELSWRRRPWWSRLGGRPPE